MYSPGDLIFTSAGSEIVRTETGTYRDIATGQTARYFTEWYRKTSGPYSIVCKSAEVPCPVTAILETLEIAKTRKTMESYFTFAEEAFAIVREVPEMLVLNRTTVLEPVKALAMEFLLYDDIAAHPVWLSVAQATMRLIQKVEKREL
jgi:hypothetical protein